MAMADRGFSDKTLAARLEAEPKEVCAQMLGEAWESYLPRLQCVWPSGSKWISRPRPIEQFRQGPRLYVCLPSLVPNRTGGV